MTHSPRPCSRAGAPSPRSPSLVRSPAPADDVGPARPQPSTSTAAAPTVARRKPSRSVNPPPAPLRVASGAQRAALPFLLRLSCWGCVSVLAAAIWSVLALVFWSLPTI